MGSPAPSCRSRTTTRASTPTSCHPARSSTCRRATPRSTASPSPSHPRNTAPGPSAEIFAVGCGLRVGLVGRGLTRNEPDQVVRVRDRQAVTLELDLGAGVVVDEFEDAHVDPRVHLHVEPL